MRQTNPACIATDEYVCPSVTVRAHPSRNRHLDIHANPRRIPADQWVKPWDEFAVPAHGTPLPPPSAVLYGDGPY